MLRANNAPVTWHELEVFTTAVLVELDAPAEEREPFELLLAVDGGARVLIVSGTASMAGTAVQAAADQLFAAPRRMAAMVSVTGWSPSPAEPIVASWLVVAVASGLPVLSGAKRIVEDRLWTPLGPSELPWFALSSAAGLRGTAACIVGQMRSRNPRWTTVGACDPAATGKSRRSAERS